MKKSIVGIAPTSSKNPTNQSISSRFWHYLITLWGGYIKWAAMVAITLIPIMVVMWCYSLCINVELKPIAIAVVSGFSLGFATALMLHKFRR